MATINSAEGEQVLATELDTRFGQGRPDEDIVRTIYDNPQWLGQLVHDLAYDVYATAGFQDQDPTAVRERELDLLGKVPTTELPPTPKAHVIQEIARAAGLALTQETTELTACSSPCASCAQGDIDPACTRVGRALASQDYTGSEVIVFREFGRVVGRTSDKHEIKVTLADVISGFYDRREELAERARSGLEDE
jgi:hypothetical protein